MEIEIGKKRKAFVKVDKDDYEKFFVKGNFIFLSTHKPQPYAVISRYTGMKNGRMQYWRSYLHREIMGVSRAKQIDHINGDGLDNRKENLRICTDKGNSKNKGPFKGKYKGVHKHSKNDVWIAQITLNYKCHHLGSFKTELEAAKAYNRAAKRMHGKYAFLNVVA